VYNKDERPVDIPARRRRVSIRKFGTFRLRFCPSPLVERVPVETKTASGCFWRQITTRAGRPLGTSRAPRERLTGRRVRLPASDNARTARHNGAYYNDAEPTVETSRGEATVLSASTRPGSAPTRAFCVRTRRAEPNRSGQYSTSTRPTAGNSNGPRIGRDRTGRRRFGFRVVLYCAGRGTIAEFPCPTWTTGRSPSISNADYFVPRSTPGASSSGLRDRRYFYSGRVFRFGR